MESDMRLGAQLAAQKAVFEDLAKATQGVAVEQISLGNELSIFDRLCGKRSKSRERTGGSNYTPKKKKRKKK